MGCTVKLALVQHDTVWADREANFERIGPLVARAATDGARLVLLPEMFSTGFVVDRDDIGEPEGGASSTFLADLARRHRVWVGGSCPEVSPDDPRPYNSFVLAGPHGEMHRYRKIHRFTFGGEDRHFRPGGELVTVRIDDLSVSLFVCYDLRFADEFWRLAPDTDLYLVPANWPSSRREHWLSLLRARAIENQAYVAGCNRVGSGGGLDYGGDSRVFDPLGTPIAEAGSDAGITWADIDLATVRDVRATYPFMRDRR